VNPEASASPAGDAELLSKILKIQLDDLLLDPGCIGGLGLGG
jgi:hypothetical protein